MSTVKLTIRHVDNLGKKNTEIFTCDPAKINANISSDTATAIDTWARGFVALSTDTYSDAEITQTQSVDEIISE